MADETISEFKIGTMKLTEKYYPTKQAKITGIPNSEKAYYTFSKPKYDTRFKSNPFRESYSKGNYITLKAHSCIASTVNGKAGYYYCYATSEKMANGNTAWWVRIKNNNERWGLYKITNSKGATVAKFLDIYGNKPLPTNTSKGNTNISNKSEQSNANASDDAQNAIDEAANNSNIATAIEGLLSASTGYAPDSSTIGLFDKTWSQSSSGAEFFDIRSVLGVFGLPYQFLPIADPRLYNVTDDAGYKDINYMSDYGDTRGVGSEYAKYIVEQMPILFMSPGKPAFMGTYSADEKSNILETLVRQAGNLIDSIGLDELLQNSGKYYVFEYDVVEYYKYVNPMCRIAAAYMNVATNYLDGVALQSVDWMDYTMSKLSGIFGSANQSIMDYVSIPFYIESETQISDSFGNSTTDSTLASTVNSVSDMARELQFILGNVGTASEIDALVGDADVTANAENLQNTIDKLMGGGNNFLGNIKNHLVSVATGGKMVFPKIWSGSDFSRSYNVTVKLRSPDMDNLSLYFNIVVPTLHLVGFVAPHMLGTDPNSYGNPFLVRAIYKGFFNIDMGIITSMDINRGDESRWNANGVPTVVDVSFTITDLYEVMSITKTDSTKWKYDTLNNTTQMDYIANFCGINIYKPEIGRTISMWFVNNFTNRARDFISLNVWGNIQQSVAQAITNIFR